MGKRRMILTAGPSVSGREIRYITDAARNGWNEEWNAYLLKFEKAFARFTDTRYAMSLSSCTGGLHLALAALGVKAGDEVIVPDLTWIATASVAGYVGARPVFADVEPDTWCIDPESIRKRVTRRTKAIIPVHLYGHPADMDAINRIAKRKGIYVIEDAAPSPGAEYKGRRTGGLGDAAAFSFQGAKIMTTGEGGVVVTNDKRLIGRMALLGDHGRDRRKAFWISETGYKYKMSNIQAAFGLAQLERLPGFVKRKRRIFGWYKERLGDIRGLRLNTERPGVKNIYWMTSLVLEGRFAADRDSLIKRLRAKGVDSRPFFYPVSRFPMYSRAGRAGNPVAARLSRRGMNLPSGVNLTEKQVDYVCSSIRRILGV